MASQKFSFLIFGFLCVLLFVWWTHESSTLFSNRVDHMSQNSFDTKYSRDAISKTQKTDLYSVLAPKQWSTEDMYMAIVIGHTKSDAHNFPRHCQCKRNGFYVTNDTCKIREADVVIFTVGARRNLTVETWRQYHRYRRPSQLWVLGTRESPQTCVAVRPPEGMVKPYNLSFTYHSRANFPTPYGRFIKFDSPQYGAINWFSRKSRLIQWSSSHCPLSERHYPRRDFVYALKEYLNITMYGTCGDGRFDGDNYTAAVSEHKFTLALENSCCSEYISEKFWDALIVFKNVPVVYGATREEYERIAPPNSFIFVQDFSSLQELADYIMDVGSDEDRYNEFHNWRKIGHGTKHRFAVDRVFRCKSICRMSDKVKEAKTGKIFEFDENSEVYFGGCRNCKSEIDKFLPTKN